MYWLVVHWICQFYDCNTPGWKGSNWPRFILSRIDLLIYDCTVGHSRIDHLHFLLFLSVYDNNVLTKCSNVEMTAMAKTFFKNDDKNDDENDTSNKLKITTVILLATKRRCILYTVYRIFLLNSNNNNIALTRVQKWVIFTTTISVKYYFDSRTNRKHDSY